MTNKKTKILSFVMMIIILALLSSCVLQDGQIGRTHDDTVADQNRCEYINRDPNVNLNIEESIAVHIDSEKASAAFKTYYSGANKIEFLPIYDRMLTYTDRSLCVFYSGEELLGVIPVDFSSSSPSLDEISIESDSGNLITGKHIERYFKEALKNHPEFVFYGAILYTDRNTDTLGAADVLGKLPGEDEFKFYGTAGDDAARIDFHIAIKRFSFIEPFTTAEDGAKQLSEYYRFRENVIAANPVCDPNFEQSEEISLLYTTSIKDDSDDYRALFNTHDWVYALPLLPSGDEGRDNYKLFLFYYKDALIGELVVYRDSVGGGYYTHSLRIAEKDSEGRFISLGESKFSKSVADYLSKQGENDVIGGVRVTSDGYEVVPTVG